MMIAEMMPANPKCPFCDATLAVFVGEEHEGEEWYCDGCESVIVLAYDDEDDGEDYDEDDDFYVDVDDEYWGFPSSPRKRRMISSQNITRYYAVTSPWGYLWGEYRSKRLAIKNAKTWANLCGSPLTVTKWSVTGESGHEDTIYPARPHRSPRSRRPFTLDDIPF